MPGPVVDPVVTPEQQVQAAANVIMMRTAASPRAAIEVAAEVLKAVHDLMKPLPRCGEWSDNFSCNREPGHPPPHEAYGMDRDTPVKVWR